MDSPVLLHSTRVHWQLHVRPNRTGDGGLNDHGSAIIAEVDAEARLRYNWRMVLKGFCMLLLISERFSNLEVSISSKGVAGSCNTRSIGLPRYTTPSDIERFPLLLYRSSSSYFGMWGGILR